MSDFWRAQLARQELGKTWEPELVERFMDGARKAGLEVAADERTTTAKRAICTGSNDSLRNR